MNIQVKIIPHKSQRYDTCGDWWFTSSGDLEIRVSKLGNWMYESLIAIHEIIEATLCKARKISEKKVTAFDVAYEKKRKKGDVSEPGDDKKAPYFYEHQFASMIEADLGRQLEINWFKYSKKVDSL